MKTKPSTQDTDSKPHGPAVCCGAVNAAPAGSGIEERYARAVELLRGAQDDIRRLKSEISLLRAQVYVVNVMAQTAKVTPVFEPETFLGDYTEQNIGNLLWFEEKQQREKEIHAAVAMRVQAELRARELNAVENLKEAFEASAPVKLSSVRPRVRNRKR